MVEEVTEEEGNKFAKEIGAFFYMTSAKESVGIYELFSEIAKQFVNYKDSNRYDGDDENCPTHVLSKNNSLKKTKKKSCC